MPLHRVSRFFHARNRIETLPIRKPHHPHAPQSLLTAFRPVLSIRLSPRHESASNRRTKRARASVSEALAARPHHAQITYAEPMRILESLLRDFHGPALTQIPERRKNSSEWRLRAPGCMSGPGTNGLSPQRADPAPLPSLLRDFHGPTLARTPRRPESALKAPLRASAGIVRGYRSRVLRREQRPASKFAEKPKLTLDNNATNLYDPARNEPAPCNTDRTRHTKPRTTKQHVKASTAPEPTQV